MDIKYLYHKAVCSKCGRKILIEISSIGTAHQMIQNVVCAECVGEIDENFRKLHPRAADDIERWVKEELITPNS